MKKRNILVTGGAGFIGSNLTKFFVESDEYDLVRVVDDLSTGFKSNIQELIDNKSIEFIEASITDYQTCLELTKDVHQVSHQAALGSVPRSIKNPIATNDANINGTLNILYAAVQNELDRVVFAASSSTYGDSKILPKVEDQIGKPLSPYAVTKLVSEIYADVFAKVYGLNYIGLRYFNVFGTNQSPNGAYAAVIPKFIDLIANGESPVINGDGSFSRDFTYIRDVVHANHMANTTTSNDALNNIYNVAFGNRTTLNEMVEMIAEAFRKKVNCIYGPERPGDVPHSHADTSKARRLLNYDPQVPIAEGIKRTVLEFIG